MVRIEGARIVLWVWLFVSFVGLGMVSLDPDYGWHVGMGKYILEKGIPNKDPFSFTMPSYPFVDHEWLLNVGFKFAEDSVGKNGLAVIFGLMVVGTLWLVRKGLGWELGVVLAAGILFGRSGVRPQVLDWLLIALMWRLFEKQERWRSWRWIMVLVFLAWVNLHGGFAIGVLMLLFMNTVRAIEDKAWRQDWGNWAALGASFLATFINPYGTRIWWEVWMQLSDRQLRQNIAEWQPFIATVEPSFWFLGVLWVMLAAREVKMRKAVWWRIATVGVLLAAGISSLRHMAVFAVIACFELPRLFESFLAEFNDKLVRSRAREMYLLFLTIAIGVLLLVQYLGFTNFIKGSLNYPAGAIEFLKSKEVFGNVFSEYGWGGYLIWKYPEKKVFIDGRMPSWRHVAPEGEADNAMEEYKEIVIEADYGEIFEKYDVQMVLFPRPTKPSFGDELNDRLSKIVKRTLGLKDKENKSLLEELEKDGWVKVYEDSVTVLYKEN